MNKKTLLSTLMLLMAFAGVLAQQPFGGCWHPDYIKNWTPTTDPDAKFNRSTVPLQPRFYDDGIKANPNQHYTGKVAACLTMNPMCSQTPAQGANNFIGYNPNEWQYMDLLVWWGGSAGEGIIIPPSAPVTDIAHLNGVKVLGNVFFPPGAYGGQSAWVYQMLTTDGSAYPYAKKLYEIAKYYGFDGWFLNEETVGGNKSEWTNFINYFYQCAAADGNNNMEIQWYDMGQDASSVSNILSTSANTSFFANYGSANSGTIESNMSAIKGMGYTTEQVFKKLYSGIECAQGGLFGNKGGFDACFPASQHKSSIQLFNPEEHIWKKVVQDMLGTPNAEGEQAYTAMNAVFDKSAGFFVNSVKDPTNTSARAGGIWPGLSNGIMERSVIQSKPFVTSFSMGLGKHRFVNGQKKGTQDWYHRGMQDILPTWRWWIDATDGGSKSDIKFTSNWDEAYNVGTSITVSGKLIAGANYLTRLYKTKLPVTSGDKFELVYKTANTGTIQLKLATIEDVNTFTTFPVTETSTQNGWSVATIDLSSLAGKTVAVIALNLTSATAIENYNVTLGQLGIMPAGYTPTATPVVNLRSQNQLKEEISDIRLIWDAPTDVNIHHYNVYLERNGVKILVGQTRNEGFYIPKFTRTAGEQNLKVYVATVTKDLKEGSEVNMTMDYPQMGLPVVSLKAAKTLVKVDEEVTVIALANNNPTTYTWTTPANAVLVSQTGNQATFKFTQGGVYDIKVNVGNAVGNTECEVKAYIEVSNSKITENVAKGKVIHSVSGFIDPEKPQWLIDGVEVPGSVRNKWCVGGAKSHWVIIDLQNTYKLYQFKIFDCGHKESPSDNFKNYKIELSKDGNTWTEALNETNIPATAAYNTKEAWIKPTVARYIRFTPYDEEMPITIRVWEFQAFGTQGNLSLEAKPAQTVNIDNNLPMTLTYSLGADAKETNFDISVVSDVNLVTIENKNITANAVNFDIHAGANAGKANITVTLINGDYTKSSTFEVKIQDPNNTNILLNKPLKVILDGSSYDEQNNTSATVGAIGTKGINDGNEGTWWNSPYLDQKVAYQIITFDLGENYQINSFVGKFRNSSVMALPEGIKVYASTTGESDSDYTLVAQGTNTTNNNYELPQTPAIVSRYLKFIIQTKSWYGFSLRELEAYGKKATSVGFEYNAKKETFTIYPNPVRRGETIKLNVETAATVQIVSLQGAVLVSQIVKGDNTRLNTQNLQPGTYMVVIKNNNNNIKTAKLLVK